MASSTPTPNADDPTADGTASAPLGTPTVRSRAPALRSDAETADFRGQDPSDAPRFGAREQLDVSAELLAAFGDRYELGEQLGAGGFGAVYRAFDRRLNRAVAIKAARTVGDPEHMLREARALAQLRHDGIVTVFDVSVSATCCLVVSELLPGPSLSAWLEANRPAPADAVRIVAAVADALAHAHAKSIVHRDIKPSNIVFAAGLRPVLVDFGLALSDLDVAAERGVVAGTPSFMSPEQAGGRGHRPDGRTDIYGLAATLYAMLCGRAPFRGRTADVIRQVCEDEPQPVRQLRPDVTPELERVCARGMAKLPADRYTTAGDFADALRRAVGLLPTLPGTPPVPSAPAPAEPAPPVAQPRPAARPAPVPPPSVRSGPRSERRQVTLLQCAFEPRADDDDPMEQVSAFQAVCAEAVAAHGGLPLQTAGTAFLACFGYPVAREDAPRQAVRAALAIAGRTTAVAVGTGPAVVTEQPPAPPVVIGDVATATAALLAQSARTGVHLTDPTCKLVAGYFDCEEAGEVTPRGTAPVKVYTVRAARAARNRVEAADPARLSPLVGRDREVGLLKERWELTAEGVQNVILLVADPGLGKSRLVRVLRDFVLQSPDGSPPDASGSTAAHASVIEWYCSPYHQSSPFYPVIDCFDRAYRLGREPDPGRRLDRLVTGLREDGLHDPEDQALLAAMLSVPGGDRLPAPALAPERLRERTQDAVLAWLNARADRAPVLFVVEDLHWVDPSTEALLANFVDRGGESRVLGLFTSRPEYDAPWKGKSVQTQVALNRLTKGQVGELIRAQSGDAAVPQAVIDQIAERTDGVPLFVEEFTRLLTERGGAAAGTIPTTLHDLLLARLDRMASDKEVVQLGAVIGRTFTYEVIAAATTTDEAALRAELDKLVGAGLLFAKGTPPRCTYTFKHALIQDAAYQSLVKKKRQSFHRAVAERLEARFPAVAETQPELLARHFGEAGETGREVTYWLKAGRRAQAAFANLEALEHLRKGLLALLTTPETGERDALELQFQTLLATATTVARGWGAPGLDAIHDRARALCARIGPDAPTFAVTWGQWAWRLLRAEMDRAGALAADLERQAAALDEGYAMEACFATVCTAHFRGDPVRAIEHAPRGLALHDRARCATHARYTGQNAFCSISAFYSWALALRGDRAAALRVADASIAESQATGDRYSEQFARYHRGCVKQHFGDGPGARAIGEAVVAASAQYGFGTLVALGTLCRGAGLVIDGADVEQGLQALDAGVRGFRSAGAELSLTAYLAVTAEAHLRAGRPERARATLDEALALVARSGERFHLANLHRICGDLLAVTDPGAALAEYEAALAVARAQGALSWELRAATAKLRLLKSLGRGAGGRPALAAVCAKLADLEPTPDALAARALLAEPD